MKVNVNIDVDKFMKDLTEATSAALERTGQEAIDQVRNSFSSSSPSTPGSPPAKVSGTLSDAIAYDIDGNNLNLGIRQGSLAENYAMAQEFGAVINPTSAEFLHFYITDSDQWVKTKTVILPPRPFLRPVLNSGFIQTSFLDNMSAEMSKKGY